MKAMEIKPTVMKVMPRPWSPAGTSLYLSFLAYARQSDDGQCPANTAAETEYHALAEIVVAFHHEQRPAKNGAVHGNQWQEDAQGVVERREKTVQQHFENLHHCRNHADIRDQPEKRQIRFRQSGPGQRAVLQKVQVDQVVDGNRNRLDDYHGRAEPQSRIHLLGHGQEGTHAQEEGQREILDKYRTDKKTQSGFHQTASVRWTT